MKFSFEQFIKFLLPRDVFDDYVVFSKGKPVYESFPAGISYVKEDSLLGLKNGMGSSGVRSQVISGTAYKMFLQPVGFDANNEADLIRLEQGVDKPITPGAPPNSKTPPDKTGTKGQKGLPVAPDSPQGMVQDRQLMPSQSAPGYPHNAPASGGAGDE